MEWVFDKSHIGLLSTVLAIVFVIGLKRLTWRVTDDLYDGLKNAGKRSLRRILPRRRRKEPASGNRPINDGSTEERSPANAQEPANAAVSTARGRYHALAPLATGDVATLHTATFDSAGGERAGTQVVIKVARSKADNDLMQNEVTTLRALHVDAQRYAKHLPQVLDQFRTGDDRLGTVLSRLDGYDLHALRQRFPQGVEPRHVVWIFRRALSVLGYTHSQGILHGNIDPSHIIVRPGDHNLWLVDWCYAITRPRETGQGFRIHNGAYSAPEVAQQRRPIPAADLYSLALCMVYLLGGDPADRVMAASVPAPLQQFIRFFLSPSAIQRPQDAWEMYHKLEELRDQLFGPHRFVEFTV